MNKTIIKGYFDGACAPYNPHGHMGMGCWAAINEVEIFANHGYVAASESNSNNVAEYLALELLLDYLLTLEKGQYWIHIHGDSKLVVKQMRGNWKIKEGLYVQYALRCQAKLKQLKKLNEYRIDWIGRYYNQRADELSNKEFIERKIPTYEKTQSRRQRRSSAI